MARRGGRLVRAGRVLGRALRQRCPRCGHGRLYVRWNRLADACEACGLRYLLDQGDPWVFLLLLDRALFVFPPIVLIYFGWLPASVSLRVLEFLALIALLVATTPHRYALAVALDCLTRGRDAPEPTA